MEKSSQNLNSIMHKVAKKFEDLSQYVSDK